MKPPLISVVVCTYNGELFLSDTIESILTQTYSNFEIIFVDDGSIDKTVAIIKKYARKDPRIRLYIRENSGLPASRNFAFSHAKGKWIAIIDQDDICYPDRLKKQLEISAQFPSAGLIFCNVDYINAKSKKIGSHLHAFSLPNSFIPKIIAGKLLLSQGCYVDSEACFIKLAVIRDIGLLDKSLRYACDFEYFIRVGFKYDFAYSLDTLAAWRIHPNQESMTNPYKFMEYRSVLLKYLFWINLDFKTQLIIIFNLLRSYIAENYRNLKKLI